MYMYIYMYICIFNIYIYTHTHIYIYRAADTGSLKCISIAQLNRAGGGKLFDVGLRKIFIYHREHMWTMGT